MAMAILNSETSTSHLEVFFVFHCDRAKFEQNITNSFQHHRYYYYCQLLLLLHLLLLLMQLLLSLVSNIPVTIDETSSIAVIELIIEQWL